MKAVYCTICGAETPNHKLDNLGVCTPCYLEGEARKRQNRKQGELIGYSYNDGGRRVAGYKGDTRDCVVRAFCILTGADYKETYRELASLESATTGGSKTARNGIHKPVRDAYFAKHGLEKVRLPKGSRPTFTEAFDRYGPCIVSTTKHVAALTDGALQDTEDCRTYEMDSREDSYETGGVFERKAMSVWVLPKKGE